MRCDLCGKPVFERIYGQVDGERMLLCPECAGAFGSEIEESRNINFPRKQPVQQKPRTDLSEGLDLKQNYGLIIRQKRQKLGLTVEELARKIFEKESILHKVENQKLVPSDSLVLKLEKALQFTLREKIED